MCSQDDKRPLPLSANHVRECLAPEGEGLPLDLPAICLQRFCDIVGRQAIRLATDGARAQITERLNVAQGALSIESTRCVSASAADKEAGQQEQGDR